MFGEQKKEEDLQEAFELLEELELSSPEELEEQRARGVVKINTACWLRPANIRDRDTLVLEGKANELTKSQLQAVFDRPVLVGDVYYVVVDRDQIDVPPCYGQCTSSRMLHTTAFSATIEFFSTLDFKVRSGEHDVCRLR